MSDKPQRQFKLPRLITAILVAGGVSLAGATQAQAETLKFAHVYETSTPYQKWALWAAEQIEERTDGRYTIEVYPASSLGKEADINEALQLGTVDLIYTGNQFAGASTVLSALPVRLTCSATSITGKPMPIAIFSRRSLKATRTPPAMCRWR